MSNEQSISRLFNVVRHRSRIQDIALELLDLLRSNRDGRAATNRVANGYDLLVGVTFSLWRAIFLAEPVDEWSVALVSAEAFLEKVLRDNAIGYADDWNNRRWSFHYYLANARMRLLEFAELYPEFGAELKRARHLKLVNIPDIRANPFDAWLANCNVLSDAIELLRQNSSGKSAFQTWTGKKKR